MARRTIVCRFSHATRHQPLHRAAQLAALSQDTSLAHASPLLLHHKGPDPTASPSQQLLRSLLDGYRPRFRPHRLGREAEANLRLAPQQQMCYYNGKLFGGYLTLLLDQILADCCRPPDQHRSAVTAYLNTSFRQSVPPHVPIRLRAWPHQVEGRKIYLHGAVEIPRDDGQGMVPAILAEALFIQPKS
ncbi:PaaI family thioesterase [Aspergillus melleus]|uniref:PaaI family thioesterase n=1 Tax=Aspergillus melleus TaxID=138277 RepID=UPI001E8CE482|nr:uncharacterized protein LDX57_007771 [Aspergillus melleus]KAH8430101.1 hypothetical protein LDX57_007771 [Aspergillus melleus]